MENENKIVDEFVKMSKEETEKESKGYKIIIENLETSEKDEYITDCLLAVVNNKGEGKVSQLIITQCDIMIMIQSIKALEKVKRDVMLSLLKGLSRIGEEVFEDNE